MKRQTKLIVLISSFCLILAIGLFGVFAVTSLNFSIGGRVVFKAEGVNAKVYDAQFSGMTVSDETAFKTFTVSTTSENPSEGFATWGKSGIIYNIGETGEGTASIKVENTTTNGEKIKVETTITGGTETLSITANAGTVIGQGASHTIVITFKVVNTNVNATIDFAIAIKLSLQGDVTYDTTQTGSVMTATVSDGKAAITYTGNETNVVIPNYVKTASGTHPVTEIASRAFQGKTNITSIIIPEGITKIGEYAFVGCSGLTGELVIPESVTTIEIGAFNNTNLPNLTLIIKGSPKIGGYLNEFGYIGTIIFEGEANITETFVNPSECNKIVIKSNINGSFFSMIDELWIENKEYLQNNVISTDMFENQFPNRLNGVYILKDIAQYASFAIGEPSWLDEKQYRLIQDTSYQSTTHNKYVLQQVQ